MAGTMKSQILNAGCYVQVPEVDFQRLWRRFGQRSDRGIHHGIALFDLRAATLTIQRRRCHMSVQRYDAPGTMVRAQDGEWVRAAHWQQAVKLIQEFVGMRAMMMDMSALEERAAQYLREIRAPQSDAFSGDSTSSV